MPFSSARGALLCILTATLLIAQDWQTSQNLPAVDFTGLTPAQKALALKVLRSNGCPCGCAMKLAECRTKDPNCSFSKALAAIVVDSVKKGAKEAAVLAAVDASPLMHRAAPKLLENPVVIPIDGAPFVGPKDARVTIVEFSDFQCPYCAQAVVKLNAILKAYPNQVKLIFKQFPLDMHSQAALAAAAAVAAHRQGKFWPLHDALFAGPHANSANEIAKIPQAPMVLQNCNKDRLLEFFGCPLVSPAVQDIPDGLQSRIVIAGRGAGAVADG